MTKEYIKGMYAQYGSAVLSSYDQEENCPIFQNDMLLIIGGLNSFGIILMIEFLYCYWVSKLTKNNMWEQYDHSKVFHNNQGWNPFRDPKTEMIVYAIMKSIKFYI